jgi:DNA topoisomerase-1
MRETSATSAAAMPAASTRSTTSGGRSAGTCGRKPGRSRTEGRATGVNGATDATGPGPRNESAASESARLRFYADAQAGIARRRAGRGFRYLTSEGRPVRDPQTLARIKSLAIPPAWADVWICPDPSGHLQATGRDARGRKQYRYHQLFRRRRERAKFDRLVEFGRALPRIRRRVDADLSQPGLPRSKVLAAVIRLLELTLIRVGNEEYARLNRSFGLTTLRGRHVLVEGSRVRFRFRGKSGSAVEVGLIDRRIARVVARCQELPGQELFQYVGDDGEGRPIASEDVNDYLREASGRDVTAKTFRTWAATVLACRALSRVEQDDRQHMAKRQVVAAMRDVASRLGNTPAVVRQSYVHPAVMDAFLDGSLAEAAGGAPARSRDGSPVDQPVLTRRDELALLRVLEHRTGGRRNS